MEAAGAIASEILAVAEARAVELARPFLSGRVYRRHRTVRPYPIPPPAACMNDIAGDRSELEAWQASLDPVARRDLETFKGFLSEEHRGIPSGVFGECARWAVPHTRRLEDGS